MVGPAMPEKPELSDIAVRFEFALPGADELRDLLTRVVRRLPRETPAARVALSRADSGGHRRRTCRA